MSEHKQILIKNGEIMDGSGSPSYKGDLLISGGKIRTIEKSLKASSDEVIDADGYIVSPGFIDIHSHSDMSIHFDNRLESTIHQGVTTAVVGNCGCSLAPVNEERLEILKQDIEVYAPPGAELSFTWRSFAEYLAAIENHQTSTNIVPLVGFGTIRIAGGPGYEDRSPTDDELSCMKAYVEEAMQSGAFGMSTGLIYAPQVYAQTEEIMELAKIVARYKGLYFSHIRGEGETVVKAVKELIEIVKESGCRGGQIAHHKVAGPRYWGASKETLKMIEQANKEGLDITCDQYPYNRGMTSMITLLPPWVHVGGIPGIMDRLRDLRIRDKIERDILLGIEGWENMLGLAGIDGIYIASVKTSKWKWTEGMSLGEIMIEKEFTNGYALALDMLLDENCGIEMTVEDIGEEDIHRIMKNPYTMIGSDGSGVSPEGIMSHGKPHPRFYGTYPRILGRFVREKKLLTMQEAIRKMTGFPAQKLGLSDRGLIKEGYWADLVIFDPKTVIDTATYTDPHQFPESVHYVIVNGITVVENGKQGKYLPGRVLRHAA